MSGLGRRLLRLARGSAVDLTPVDANGATALRPEDFAVAPLAAHEIHEAQHAGDDAGYDDVNGRLETMLAAEVTPTPPAPAMLQLGAMTLAPGQIALLRAAPGADSEQLLAQVLGLTAVTMPDIALWGHPVARLRPAAMRAMRQRIGVVPQRLQLLDRRSVFDNVALPLEIDAVPGGELIARAEEILAAFDLAKVAGRAVGTLSLAMQQRVAFARACVRRPAMLLTDQLTLHQDDGGAAFFADQLEALGQAGAAALVVTDDRRLLERAARAAWPTYLLQDGLPATATAPATPATPETLEFAIDFESAAPTRAHLDAPTGLTIAHAVGYAD